LNFLIFKLKDEPVDMHVADPILDAANLCKIPFDEREVIVERLNRQNLISIQIAVTNIDCLKSYLSDVVTSIEAGKPTA